MGAELIFLAIPLFLLLLLGLCLLVPPGAEGQAVGDDLPSPPVPRLDLNSQSLESTAHPMHLTVYSHDPYRD